MTSRDNLMTSRDVPESLLDDGMEPSQQEVHPGPFVRGLVDTVSGDAVECTQHICFDTWGYLHN